MRFSFPQEQSSPNPPSCVLLSPAVCACFQEKAVSLSFPFSTQVISDLIIPQQCCAHSWLCGVLSDESITANHPDFWLAALAWAHSQITEQFFRGVVYA